MSDRCPDCGCEVPDSGSGVPEADCVVCELQDMITALRAELAAAVAERDGLRKAVECRGIVDCTGDTPVVRKVDTFGFQHGARTFICREPYEPKPGDAPACVKCGACVVGFQDQWKCLVCGTETARAALAKEGT